MYLYGLLSLLLGLAGNSGMVTWIDVEQAIQESVCLAERSDSSGDLYVSFQGREACGSAPAATAVERAVEAALRRSFPVLTSAPVPMFSAELGAARSRTDPSAQQRTVVEALLKNEYFRGIVIPRTTRELSSQGTSCRDCPTVLAHDLRSVTWDELVPYMSVFIHPTVSATDYRFSVCGVVDPTRPTPDDDPFLLRAGLIAAQASLSVYDAIGRVLDGIRGGAQIVVSRPETHWRQEVDRSPGPGSRAVEKPSCLSGFRVGNNNLRTTTDGIGAELEDDEVRADMADLHGLLEEELRADARVQREVCETLRPFATDLGIELTFCNP